VNLVILGLGNPGVDYEHSRHNVGQWFVNHFVKLQKASFHASSSYQICSFPFAGGKLTLAKSVNYMNQNGQGIKKLLNTLLGKKDEFVIVHDELDLPIGRVKLSHGKSAAGHNGVTSVLEQLNFSPLRLRIGIGATRHPDLSSSEFVLSRFSNEEQLCLNSLSSTFIHSFRLLLTRGLSFALNFTNSYPLNKPTLL
jgi:PTH1 family peptidyl-tRNA hydrolase